ncbi:GAF and ANTAR domain-containing protein [Phycicoccus ginsengisoli]
MSLSFHPETTRALRAVAERVYRGDGPQDVLGDIVELVARVVPGADHVSLSSLQPDDTLLTRAANDDVARHLDLLESRAKEGPCLDSIEEDSVQRAPDIAHDSPWPRLTELVLAETPVRGMLGYQLLTPGRSALNLFSDTAGVLTEDVADEAALLAGFAAVALTALERREDAQALRHRLGEDRERGKAVGLIMATHRVAEHEAVRRLESASHLANERLGRD